MIHFDFDDRYQDELVVGSAISKREGVLFSTLLHAVLLGLILFGPEWSFLKPDPAEIEARQQELERIQRERGAVGSDAIEVEDGTSVPAGLRPIQVHELARKIAAKAFVGDLLTAWKEVAR